MHSDDPKNKYHKNTVILYFRGGLKAFSETQSGQAFEDQLILLKKRADSMGYIHTDIDQKLFDYLYYCFFKGITPDKEKIENPYSLLKEGVKDWDKEEYISRKIIDGENVQKKIMTYGKSLGAMLNEKSNNNKN